MAREIGGDLSAPMASAVPQEVMHFVQQPGVMIQQETNLCCKCCCCEPNINYRMQPYIEDYRAGENLQAVWYMAEDAGFLGRCCALMYPGAKSTKWTVHDGPDTSGAVLMTHEKDWTCSHCPLVCISDSDWIRCPCCCCLPYLTTKGPDGQVLGHTRYVCDMCIFVPKFDIHLGAGEPAYRIRPDTCCGGFCVKPRLRTGTQGGSRGGRFRVPYLIREGNEPYNQIGDAAITDLWAGFKKECCTKQETFGVRFPRDAEPLDHHNKFARKATFVGATLLINTLMFDHE